MVLIYANLKQMNTDSFFSVVFQDYVLFPFKLAQNVATDTEYNQSFVKKCLEDAGLKERITDSGMDMETYLYKDFDDTGIEISGGEAQKNCYCKGSLQKFTIYTSG